MYEVFANLIIDHNLIVQIVAAVVLLYSIVMLVTAPKKKEKQRVSYRVLFGLYTIMLVLLNVFIYWVGHR
ncbi:hypothetical protein [Bacillus sp. NMCC4]|uniref:hypothetical protein n=1 Tax=unclassified Bacillus (in: firmicutes) TaxID=185979 RepID=UPI000D034ED4|nr:hypothetical protein [Bacillus sp. NMCC4]PRS35728.1 hypothetical protein C6Y02_17095 [Bacillus sp. NMCC4]